jgi:hypothetical protein
MVLVSVASVNSAPAYALDGENYLCAKPFESYPLPCKAPRDEWDFALKDKFVITAWWPPTVQQLDLYAAAHFNLVLSGNLVMSACQPRPGYPPATSKLIPNPATQDEAFACFLEQLPKIEALGLKVAWSTGGSYNRSKTSYTLGGNKSYGGVFQNAPSSHYITDRETAYAVGEFERLNLSHLISQIFLHDDDADVGGNTAAAADWLRLNAKSYPPQVNTFPDSGKCQCKYQWTAVCHPRTATTSTMARTNHYCHQSPPPPPSITTSTNHHR